MDSWNRIERNQKVSIKDISKEISEELQAARMGGALENQEAPIVKSGEILLKFVNGQSFTLSIKENKE